MMVIGIGFLCLSFAFAFVGYRIITTNIPMKVYVIEIGAYEQITIIDLFESEEKARLSRPEVKEWEVVENNPRRLVDANRDKRSYVVYEGATITEYEVK